MIIADLTEGTGRFNLTRGATAMATGLGATFSTAASGIRVKRFGYNAGFLALAGIAALALLFFGIRMPETRPEGDGKRKGSGRD